MKPPIFLTLIFSFACAASLAGCGVKGAPLPPLTPPVLGRGEPSYSRATKDVRVRPQVIKKGKAQDDWDNDDDFAPDSQK